jgi:2-polyprenyl-6-methoxyphenol hydroxylase-like FAD-dependent oxidoreductase
MNKTVLVVGAGLGGLASALRLAKRGLGWRLSKKIPRLAEG